MCRKTGLKKSKLGSAYHNVVEEKSTGKMILIENCHKMLFVS